MLQTIRALPHRRPLVLAAAAAWVLAHYPDEVRAAALEVQMTAQGKEFGLAIGVALAVYFFVSILFIPCFGLSLFPVSHPSRDLEKLPPLEVGLIALKAIQLAAFNFLPSIPWTTDSHANDAGSIPILVIPTLSYRIIYYITVFVIIGGPVLTIFFAAIPGLAPAGIAFVLFWGYLTTTLDTAVFSQLFRSISCSYPTSPAGAKPFLDAEPSMECWSGLHIVFASCTFFALAIFIPACICRIAAPYARWTAGKAKPLSETIMSAIVGHATALTISASCIFFQQKEYIILTTLLCCNMGNFIFHQLFDCNLYQRINSLRRKLIVYSMWCTISAFIAAGIDEPKSWKSFGILCGGIGALTVIFWTMSCRKRAKEKLAKELIEKNTIAAVAAATGSTAGNVFPEPSAPQLPLPLSADRRFNLV